MERWLQLLGSGGQCCLAEVQGLGVVGVSGVVPVCRSG